MSASAPLHRNQLAWLTRAGWDALLRSCRPDAVESECLAHWARHRLPLVVTRQPVDLPGTGVIAMGLPAPLRWQRRRIALRVALQQVSRFGEFPLATEVLRLLPAALRSNWQRLCAGLDARGATARVHGSYGWQLLTGLGHVRAGSDIDLSVALTHPQQADALVAQLLAFACEQPRLDGELVFDDGSAVAWREWAAWRAGQARSILVRRIDGCALRDPAWIAETATDTEAAA